MQSQIQIFNHPKFGDVRTVINENNEPIFCLSDICNAVDLTNPSSVKSRLDKQDVYMIDLHALNYGSKLVGNTIATFVNETAFYDVILMSASEKVRPFRRWATHEVLPSIRKNGGYIASSNSDSDEEIMARALVVAQATIKRREERIAALQAENSEQQHCIEKAKPAVHFAEAVSNCASLITVNELAKLLKQNGYNTGGIRLYEQLREDGYIFKNSCEPTQRAMDLGLFRIVETVRTSSSSGAIDRTTKVTPKGQIYFVNKYTGHAPQQTINF